MHMVIGKSEDMSISRGAANFAQTISNLEADFRKWFTPGVHQVVVHMAAMLLPHMLDLELFCPFPVLPLQGQRGPMLLHSVTRAIERRPVNDGAVGGNHRGPNARTVVAL